MKILIVSRNFYPIESPRSFRTTELAVEFARQGNVVHVIIPDVSDVHIKFAQINNIVIQNMGSLIWKLPYFGQTMFGVFITRLLSRILRLFFEYPEIELFFKTREVLKNLNGYDLLISIAGPYPVHWGISCLKIHNITRKWIADCGDPYMGCKTDTFKKPFYFKYFEKRFMRKADFVTIPVESGRTAYYPEFHNKIKIIPQGFKIEPSQIHDPQINNTVPTFAYAGGFIPNIRDPRPFLGLLSEIPNAFRFIIFTNSINLIEDFKEKLKDKLEIRGYIPREELLKVLSRMDFLVNFDNNTGVQVPSKLIDYAIANRPVLNITKVLNKDVLTEFLAGNYNDALKLPDIEKFKIENVVASFLKLADGSSD